jgi:hypothetical protein
MRCRVTWNVREPTEVQPLIYLSSLEENLFTGVTGPVTGLMPVFLDSLGDASSATAESARMQGYGNYAFYPSNPYPVARRLQCYGRITPFAFMAWENFF